ncbi:MAG: hypothetical protein HQ510_05655 [Candidatus Marinimicrobia bacterium]|nr:hypothetical protein [Candidatus Neomarinimicrobiota bacterium]
MLHSWLLDYNGLINFGNCEDEYGEILVGAGIWQGEPLEITTYFHPMT